MPPTRTNVQLLPKVCQTGVFANQCTVIAKSMSAWSFRKGLRNLARAVGFPPSTDLDQLEIVFEEYLCWIK